MSIREFRFVLGAGAVALLIIQVWPRLRDSSFAELAWIFVIGSLLVSVWLGTSRRRAARWRHTRKVALALFLAGVLVGTAVLCSVSTDVPTSVDPFASE